MAPRAGPWLVRRETGLEGLGGLVVCSRLNLLYCLLADLDSSEFSIMPPDGPNVPAMFMGETGAFNFVFQDPQAAAVYFQQLLPNSCAYNFKAWLQVGCWGGKNEGELLY